MSEVPWLEEGENGATEQDIPGFRVVFTIVGSLEGFTCSPEETVEVGQLELALEVQNILNQQLLALNSEHDLDLGVVDFQTRTIPRGTPDHRRADEGEED